MREERQSLSEHASSPPSAGAAATISRSTRRQRCAISRASLSNLSFRRATEIASGLADEFVRRDLDAVFLLYNEFKSAHDPAA